MDATKSALENKILEIRVGSHLFGTDTPESDLDLLGIFMETGKVQFPLAYAQDILDIKNGKYSAEQIQKWADELVEEARGAFENSRLPKDPPGRQIEDFVMIEVENWLRSRRG